MKIDISLFDLLFIDPSDVNDQLMGEISTISTTASGYFLGNGGMSYVPTSVTNSASVCIHEELYVTFLSNLFFHCKNL